MNNDGLIIGLIITYVVLVTCILAIVAGLKWYRSNIKLTAFIMYPLVLMVIISLAAVNILQNNKLEDLETQSNVVKHYKQIYWQQHEPAEFVLSSAIELWNDAPDENSKLLLGLAYLKAEQPQKGIRIVSEVVARADKALYLSKAQLKELTEQLKLHQKYGDEEATASLTLVNAGTLPLDDEVEEDSFSSFNESSEQAEAILPLSNDEYTEASIVIGDLIAQRITEKMHGDEQQMLQSLAQLDPDRLDYVYQVGIPNGKSDQSDIDEAYILYESLSEQMLSEESALNEDVALAFELAKTSTYLNDAHTAERLLLQVLKQYPDATEPTIMFSEMLLKQQVSLSEEQLADLPFYSEAKIQQQKDEKRLLTAWASQVKPNDEESTRIVEEQLAYVQQNRDVKPQLAYALLSAQEEKQDPQVQFLLSTYHYQVQEYEEAASYIEEIASNPATLTIPQQYYVQTLQQLPDPAEMTLDDFQARNELSNQVYTSFQTLEGKRITTLPPTELEKGYAVFLSNELVTLNKSSMRITSIQASASGSVELYVSTSNMGELTKDTLSIHDNEINVKSFQLEKLGESVSYERNIVLLVDRSGSMGGERIEGAKLALKNFVSSMNNNEKVGLIAFDDGSQLTAGLSSDLTTVESAIDELNGDGGTNITGAFEHSIGLMEQQSGERIIFILSDGEDSTFSQSETRASIIEQANAAGVTIFAIGFASGYETLREVAEATGGRYIASAGLDELLSSFDEIKATMEQTYKISYQLNPMEEGLHKARLRGSDNKSTTKRYEIGDPFAESDEAWTDLHEDAVNNEIGILGTTPNRITVSNLGSTELLIEGFGFDKVEKLQLDGKDIEFKKRSDSQIKVTISNNLSIGIHELMLITQDQQEVSYGLSATNSNEQNYRDFGDAKVYGDFIVDQAGVSTLQGNTSVDHFLYDTSGKMVLKEERELTFNGLLVQVDHTKLGILSYVTAGLDNWEEKKFPDEMTMTINNDPKSFELKRSNAALDIMDKFTLGKFGLEVRILPEFTYSAKYTNDDGTLKARGGITGFSSITGLNDTLASRWNNMVKFMPTDAMIEVGYEKDNIIIGGTVGADLNFSNIIKTGSINLNVAYEHGPAKFDVAMEATDLSVDYKALKFDAAQLPVNQFGAGVGWQQSLIPKAGHALIGSNRGVPLGATGLTVRMLKLGIDGREGIGGTLGTNIGTAVDGPAQNIITWVNKVPGIDISPSACVVCIGGEIGVEKVGTSDWAANGKIALQLIGFELGNVESYMDAHEISSNITIDMINLEGHSRLLFRDSKYGGNMTLTVKGNMNVFGAEGDLIVFVDMSSFDNSYVDFYAKAWMFEPHIHFGADVTVYR